MYQIVILYGAVTTKSLDLHLRFIKFHIHLYENVGMMSKTLLKNSNLIIVDRL